MKNLRKLSRMELKSLNGGGDEGVTTCHFHYEGTLWGEDMVIIKVGEGRCPTSKGCYTFTQTSPKCEA